MTKQLADTYKQLFEDILDLALVILSLLYVFVLHDMRIELSKEIMGEIAATGAGSRFLLRRIVTRIVDIKVNGGSSEPPPAS